MEIFCLYYKIQIKQSIFSLKTSGNFHVYMKNEYINASFLVISFKPLSFFFLQTKTTTIDTTYTVLYTLNLTLNVFFFILHKNLNSLFTFFAMKHFF